MNDVQQKVLNRMRADFYSPEADAAAEAAFAAENGGIYRATITRYEAFEYSDEHVEYGANRAVLQARLDAECQKIAPGFWRNSAKSVGEVEYTCCIEPITLVC